MCVSHQHMQGSPTRQGRKFGEGPRFTFQQGQERFKDWDEIQRRVEGKRGVARPGPGQYSSAPSVNKQERFKDWDEIQRRVEGKRGVARPGPGQYSSAPSVNKQVLSQRRTMPSHSFGLRFESKVEKVDK
mmetsp:Transcript_6628/g.16560  ORF Transcript_6628/g.16560 Transcript_6628/m.16560 type:complete len:130 (+) Transcript_6628:2960-3349(+)